jgi:hypothetical protein
MMCIEISRVPLLWDSIILIPIAHPEIQVANIMAHLIKQIVGSRYKDMRVPVSIYLKYCSLGPMSSITFTGIVHKGLNPWIEARSSIISSP